MACYVLKFDGIAEPIRIPSSSDTFDLTTFAQDLNKLVENEQTEVSLISEAVPAELDPKEVLFYSGGAKGADSLWGIIAREYGFNTYHYYPKDIPNLDPKQRQEIEQQYLATVSRLGRKVVDGNTEVGWLLRRDMLQANSADSIFAISTITKNNVDGGTGYAVARGIDLKKPIFVYDLNEDRWKTYDYTVGKFLDYNYTPVITPHAAVIGTRKLTEAKARQIIEPLFQMVTKSKPVEVAEKPQERQDLVLVSPKETASKAAEIGGIDTLRHPDVNGMHFGNPFSHADLPGVQLKVPTVKEAVIAYEQWLRGEKYQEIEPLRRQWILDQINSGNLDGKPLVYYTNTVPDNSYGQKNYDYNTAPNHAHILLKLINERKIDVWKNAIDQHGYNSVEQTIQTMQSDNNELSDNEKRSIKNIIGDSRPRVLVASEHTDPVFHAKEIKKMVELELKKAPKDRQFHMMYIITKHDGLPLKELAQLKIPKFFHFSITSLGGTPYEPGVMKMDDLLDRIETFIKDGVINPDLVTIRIDPIIPGLTTQTNIRHIIERGKAMGIKQYKFSVMDSYGYTSTGERCETEQDRKIINRMKELGYDWNKYYGTNPDGTINFHAKANYVAGIYKLMDNLAEEFGIWINTCGESASIAGQFKHIKTVGCVNVDTLNAVMGTSDIANTESKQRKDCSCYGNKVDALRYDDKCASSCVYCYAKHNSDRAVQYYNEDGTLKQNRFTATQDSPLSIEEDIVPKSNLKYGSFNISYNEFTEDIKNLKALLNKYYDPKTKNYSCPPEIFDATKLKTVFTPNGKKFTDAQIQALTTKGFVTPDVGTVFFMLANTLKDTPMMIAHLAMLRSSFSSVKNVDQINQAVFNSIVKSLEQLFQQRDIPALDALLDKDLTQLWEFQLNEEAPTPNVNPQPAPAKVSVISAKSSEIMNKIKRYLDVALSLNQQVKPLQEVDKLEALNLVKQQLEGLGVTVHLMDTKQLEANGLPGNTEAAVQNGEIFVNTDLATVSSPMHEFMHLVFGVMKQTNFDTFAKIMSEAREIPEFQPFLEEVQNSEYYNNLIESDQLEEAFVRFLSKMMEGEVNTSETFEQFYQNNEGAIIDTIQSTFNVPQVIDLLDFLKQPFANLTKTGSILFVQKNHTGSGYADKKYQVDISGKIMSYIQQHMNDLIQEGECK